MLNWANRFSICSFLDNQHYQESHHSYECLLAAGTLRSIAAGAGNAFQQLQEWYQQQPDWLFGHFSYELKNEIEPLHSDHPDGIGFPDLFFFVPEFVILLNEQELNIGYNGDEHVKIWETILQTPVPGIPPFTAPITIQHRITKAEYLHTIQQLQQHILRGDCYVINFCQEFFAEQTTIDPLSVYLALSTASPNPFAAYYKLENQFLLCASPERYLKKTGSTMLSQPIKGTWQRNNNDRQEDDRNKERLYHSAKDRAENVMVVDLVRNDLSRVCEEGSVQVDELFGIYSFPQVHQMISTVSGQLRSDCSFIDAIRATFPMGSMTGAPKRRVLELIEQYEQTRRGLFSGAVGYITPNEDFDFNVVIRSILYNASQQYLSFQTGSAITFYSDPEQEYEECLLKAAAMQKVLK